MAVKRDMGKATVKARILTDKQELFCIEYVLNKGNATQAARRAGYSASSDDALGVVGFENLRNPKIIARIEQLRAESGVKTGANIEWLESMLVSAIERCARKEKVYDREGNPTGEYKFDAKGLSANASVLMRLKGWEEKATEVQIDQISDKIAAQFMEIKNANSRVDSNTGA